MSTLSVANLINVSAINIANDFTVANSLTVGTNTATIGTGSYFVSNGNVGNQVTVSWFTTFSSTDTTQDSSSFSINGLPFVASSSTNHGGCCMLTERMYGVYYSSAPHTFHALPAGGTNYMTVMENNYNGGFANASWYSSTTRACYKGGNLYMHGSLSYRVA